MQIIRFCVEILLDVCNQVYKKRESPQSIFGQFIKTNTSAKYTILCQTPTIITMRSQVFSLYSSSTSPTFEIQVSVFRAEETAMRCSPSRQRSSRLALGCSTPDRSWAVLEPPATRCCFRRRLRRRTWWSLLRHC